MIPSSDIERTARFFIDIFGFTSKMVSETYQILIKEHFSIHLLKAGIDIDEMEFYLEVDDLDGLWNSVKNKLGGIKTKAPFNQEYGMREFHVIVPHTKTLLFVAQLI